MPTAGSGDEVGRAVRTRHWSEVSKLTDRKGGLPPAWILFVDGGRLERPVQNKRLLGPCLGLLIWVTHAAECRVAPQGPAPGSQIQDGTEVELGRWLGVAHSREAEPCMFDGAVARSPAALRREVTRVSTFPGNPQGTPPQRRHCAHFRSPLGGGCAIRVRRKVGVTCQQSLQEALCLVRPDLPSRQRVVAVKVKDPVLAAHAGTVPQREGRAVAIERSGLWAACGEETWVMTSAHAEMGGKTAATRARAGALDATLLRVRAGSQVARRLRVRCSAGGPGSQLGSPRR